MSKELPGLERTVQIGGCLLNWFNQFYFGGIEIKGELPDLSDNRGTIVAGNHPSNPLIIPLITTLLGIAGNCPDDETRKRRLPHTLAKEELFRWPLGLFLREAGQIPVARSGMNIGPLKQTMNILKQNGLIVVYPERTLTKNPNGWPTPVNEEEQLAAKVKSLTPGTKKYNKIAAAVKSYKYSGEYADISRLAEKTDSLIVPTLTWPNYIGRGANVLIQFGEAMEPGSSTGEVMLRVAQMMADARGQGLPDDVRDRILGQQQ
jgi:1-acyl-sn-glycerol-3-phosphate acyltransferase